MIAPGEARTHGLQIMRLTRCLLRYGGCVSIQTTLPIHVKMQLKFLTKKNSYPRGDSNPQSSV